MPMITYPDTALLTGLVRFYCTLFLKVQQLLGAIVLGMMLAAVFYGLFRLTLKFLSWLKQKRDPKA